MYIKEPSIDNLLDAAKQLRPSSEEILIFLVGEQTKLDIESLITALNSLEIPFVGGIFPGVIYDRKHYETGVLLEKIEASHVLELDLDVDSLLEYEMKQELWNTDFKYTVMMFLDGLSPNISDFLHRLNGELANQVNYIGGGAGYLSLEQAPCLFTPTGFYQDKAILCVMPRKVGLGIQHGWKAIHGPLVATKTERNIIYELNWRNAFEVYRELVEADSGQSLLVDSFFDLAKAYPFGMSVDGEEDIVRDPILVSPEGGLVCVGEVRNNTVLYLLKGEVEDLIKSAEIAVLDALEDLGEHKVKEFFVIDCISRVFFLGDDFQEELNAFSAKLPDDLPVMKGILTLGEISSSGMKQLRFYNKTTVMAALA